MVNRDEAAAGDDPEQPTRAGTQLDDDAGTRSTTPDAPRADDPPRSEDARLEGTPEDELTEPADTTGEVASRVERWFPHRPRTDTTTPEVQRVPSWLATSTAWTWRILVLIVGFSAILYVMARLALVTIPVIVALILATLCVPPARALERRGIPRAGAAAIVVIGGLSAVLGLLAALTPAFVSQVQELQPTVVQAIDQLFAFLEASFGWDRDEVFALVQDATQQAQQAGGEIAGQVATGVAAVVQGIAALALAIVLLFFFVKDGESITAWMIDRSPDDYEDMVRGVGRRAWAALAGFVRGTATIALIDAVGIGVGLAIVGVPLVLPLALLVFLGGFIPVIGAFVSGLIAVLVALASGGFTTALIVAGIVLVVQQVESNVLQPTIMRRAVSLHPVIVLSALTAGGVLGGIIGAFLAVPVAAVASAVGNELRLRHEDRDRDGYYDRGGPQPVGPEDDPVASDEL
jgi:putative heme transporter